MALAAVTALCAACGNAAPTASSHTSHHPPTTTTTTSSSKSSTTTTVAATTTTTTPGLSRCAFSELSVSAGQFGAAMGHEGFAIEFRNAGAVACTLYGYPGVAALNSSGQQAAQAQRTPSGYLGGLPSGDTTPPLVTLSPGQVASALVEGTDVPTGTPPSPCPQYQALLVTPPTATQSVRLTQGVPGCSAIAVHPVVPGTSGRVS